VPDDEDIPPPPPEDDGPQPRNAGNHMFMSPRGQRARDVWAAQRQAVNGWQYREIAAAMGISVSNAHARVQRGLRVIEAPTLQQAETARAAHRARLEAALEVATDILYGDHVHVSHGHVVLDEQGKKVIDQAPKLAAADRIRTLSESLRKLDGLDAPTRHELSMGEIDDALAETAAALVAARAEVGEAGGAEAGQG